MITCKVFSPNLSSHKGKTKTDTRIHTLVDHTCCSILVIYICVAIKILYDDIMFDNKNRKKMIETDIIKQESNPVIIHYLYA